MLIPKVMKSKDKTFFFFNWESGRQVSGLFRRNRPGSARARSAPATSPDRRDRLSIPRPASRFPATSSPRTGSRLRAQVPGRFVPAPNTNEPGINYRGPRAAAPIDQDQYVSRIDHRFSTRTAVRQLHVQYPGRRHCPGLPLRYPRQPRPGSKPEPDRDPHILAVDGQRGARSVGTVSSSTSSSAPPTTCNLMSANLIGHPGRLEGSAQLRLPDFQPPVIRSLHARHRPARPPEPALAGHRQRFDPQGQSLHQGRRLVARRNWTFDRIGESARVVRLQWHGHSRRRNVLRATTSSPSSCWASPPTRRSASRRSPRA